MCHCSVRHWWCASDAAPSALHVSCPAALTCVSCEDTYSVLPASRPGRPNCCTMTCIPAPPPLVLLIFVPATWPPSVLHHRVSVKNVYMIMLASEGRGGPTASRVCHRGCRFVVAHVVWSVRGGCGHAAQASLQRPPPAAPPATAAGAAGLRLCAVGSDIGWI